MTAGKVLLSDELRAAILGYVSRCPTKQAALLPALHAVQQRLGLVPPEAVGEIAELIELTTYEVQEAVALYGFSNRDRPPGRHRIWVCRSDTCDARGSEEILKYLQERLRIEPGQTTPDGRITLETADCLGACDFSPAILVNDVLHEEMTRAKIDALLDSLAR
jgi:NADH-quinone oxidoreductase subunit E